MIKRTRVTNKKLSPFPMGRHTKHLNLLEVSARKSRYRSILSDDMKHQPRKRFGQNFLKDDHVIHAILRSVCPKPSDNMLEIGPGLGALTKPLLQSLKHLTAIEIDRDLQRQLQALSQAPEQFNLIAADALTMDYSQFGSNLRIIGNLPYNISTPLMIHLLHFCQWIEDMHFMLQKEVANRLTALPGNKNYGRLSVIVQYYCEVEQLFDVPPDAFYPKPQVDSSIVRIVPYKTSPYPGIEFKALEALLAQAFAMRRKTLANNLKKTISADDLRIIGINPTARPEQISVLDYVQIAKFITK